MPPVQQAALCARCQERPAVIFITNIENGVSVNKRLCLKCAKELKIRPVEDAIKKMGLTDDELDSLTDDMLKAMGDIRDLPEIVRHDNGVNAMPVPPAPAVCVECDTNPAVIFVTKVEDDGKATSKGYCLKCARALNIKPVEDIFTKMGLTGEDVDNLADKTPKEIIEFLDRQNSI